MEASTSGQVSLMAEVAQIYQSFGRFLNDMGLMEEVNYLIDFVNELVIFGQIRLLKSLLTIVGMKGNHCTFVFKVVGLGNLGVAVLITLTFLFGEHCAQLSCQRGEYMGSYWS